MPAPMPVYHAADPYNTALEFIADRSSGLEGVPSLAIEHRESLILNSNQDPNLRLLLARLPNVMRQE